MESLYILIPVGLLLMAVAGAAFFWASRSGQFDDLEQIGRRLPDDDDREA